MPRPLKLGLMLPIFEDPPTGEKHRWHEVRQMATAAEDIGFDTVWVPDELIWRFKMWPGPRGFWECVALTGAVAASTSRIQVGTWVMSTLYRNPALVAKIAETVDEIAGGRFVLGLGSGHGGTQVAEFGYPTDHTYSRFAEALEIIVPLLRGRIVEFQGTYVGAAGAEIRPRGPNAGGIPLLIGASGPKMLRLAARHADTWSWFAQERSAPEEFVPAIANLEAACAEVGRDPATIGRSVGVWIEPTDATGASAFGMGEPIRGSTARIAEALASFAEVGVTSVEIMFWPSTRRAVEALAPVVEALDKATAPA